MSSPSGYSSGDGQKPRIRVVPLRTETWGDLAGQFASDYGLTPDPWQQLVLDDWLARHGGRWASSTAGLSVPRQNGKNGALEMRELFGAAGLGEKILHTAHEVKTAQKHFRRLKHFFGSKVADPGAKFPELNAMVKELRNVNGQEAILLTNGGSIEIVARSKNSARGFTVDVVICDEAQDMSNEDLEALKPATSAAPLGNPQRIYCGTPPGPRVNGEVFARVRANATSGEAGRICWDEWSAADDDDLDDREVWRAVNPGLITGRLLWPEVEDERTEFSDEGFTRERLGRWTTAGPRSVIPMQSWAEAGDDLSRPVGNLALGIEVGPDMACASVSMAGRRDDDQWHIELVECREGADWLVPYVVQLMEMNPDLRAVVLDTKSPAATLMDDLTKAGVRVTQPSPTDLGTACTQLLSGVVTGQVHHIRQPQLSVAVSVATKRKIGDTGMWAWSRATEADITPIQSATIALWGAQTRTVKRPAPRGRTSGGRVAVVL